MKNRLFTLTALSFYLGLSAQVGINTGQGQATLDVVGSPSVTTKMDGIIAPRLTETELNKKTYASAQTGALIYITLADLAPAGQTVNVTVPGYYYFDGALWQKQTGTEWQVQGNAVGEIATTTETLGNAPASTNYLGPKGAANLVVISANKVHAVLDTSGALSGGGEDASGLSWGSSNLINNTSNNIALGRGNTANASAANFPAIAIGSSNVVSGGGKVFGAGNTATAANNFAFGGFNKTGNSVAVAVGYSNDASNGGFAFGANNVVNLNGFAIGSNNDVSQDRAVAIGVGGKALGDQNVYANKVHAFFNQSNGTDTAIGVNIIPVAAVAAAGGAIQMKGFASAANATCTAAMAGAIRYNSTTNVHEGCNGTNWKALY
ncbi:hypothetical protein [Chryseobacterium angstadtii]|nr:hypothetical protein [Chryseobacterium angstadtii]